MSTYPDVVSFSTIPVKIFAGITFAASVFVLMCAANSSSGDLALVAVGLWSLLAIILPFLVKGRFDPFEPITLFAFSVFMGCTLRSVLLAVLDPDHYQIVFLTDGMPNGKIAENAIVIPLSLALLSFGYMMGSEKRLRIQGFSVLRHAKWKQSRVWGVVFLLMLVSVAATVELSRLTGVDLSNLAGLSVKRAVEVNSGSGVEYARLGYLHWASELAKLGLFVIFITRISRGGVRQASWYSMSALLKGFVISLLLLLSVLWPVLSSSRTGILEVFFGLAVLLTYLGFEGDDKAKRKKFKRMAVVAITFALFVLVLVGVWRQYSQRGEIVDKTIGSAIISNSVGSGNFLPLERTAVIIERLPKLGDWKWGGSYLNTIFAPIPRSVWHEKPKLSLGLYVKSEIYDRPTVTNGYPPGLLGEAFINFGYLGMAVIPFIVGFLLKLTYNSFKPLLVSKNKSAVLLYSLLLWPLGFQLADLDFSLFFINLLTAVFPAVMVLSVVVSRRVA